MSKIWDFTKHFSTKINNKSEKNNLVDTYIGNCAQFNLNRKYEYRGQDVLIVSDNQTPSKHSAYMMVMMAFASISK